MSCKACLRRFYAAVEMPASKNRTTLQRSFSTLRPSSNQPGPSRIALPQISRRSRRSYSNIPQHIIRPASPPSSSSLIPPFRRTAAALARSVDPISLSPQTPLFVTPPSLDAIKEEGYLDDDVALIPQHEAWLNLTPAAITQLEKITSKESPELLAQNKLALRVGVESGGCHGYQYTMELVEERGVDDYVMQPEGVDCIPVVVDLVSLGLLKGSTLHHATELIGSSFRLQDNPQAKEGGNCGCGVSWELK